MPEQSRLPAQFAEVVQPSVPEPAAALDEAFRNRPDITQLTAQKAQVLAELALAENQVLPKLNVQLSTATNFGTGLEENDESELRTALSFQMPLQQREAIGKRRIADAKVREVDIALQFLKQRIEAEVQNSWQVMSLSRRRLQYAIEEAKLAQELEEGERTKFTLGDSNLVVLNIREQTTAEAQVREIQATADYLKSLIAYQTAIGREL